jgi:hypothetical protein
MLYESKHATMWRQGASFSLGDVLPVVLSVRLPVGVHIWGAAGARIDLCQSVGKSCHNRRQGLSIYQKVIGETAEIKEELRDP